MPELPEVEVVRAGLAPAVSGARIAAVEVRDYRALKRHVPLGGEGYSGAPDVAGAAGSLGAAADLGRRTGHGVTLGAEEGAYRAADFERRLTGARLLSPLRRGKFMWIPVESQSQTALLAHLGMSGQLLLRSHEAPDDRHVRIRLWIEHDSHGELRLDFADQRLFGSLALDELVADGADATIPGQAMHIARDPIDPLFDDAEWIGRVRRSTAIKAVLLDQTVASGVGNIYADEALWLARIHPATPGLKIGARKARELLAALRSVFTKALAEGGTSFDAQYVNVNGEAGYFAHSLNAYGRGGEPCHRCGTTMKRIPFAGRSSTFCPRCQRRR